MEGGREARRSRICIWVGAPEQRGPEQREGDRDRDKLGPEIRA